MNFDPVSRVEVTCRTRGGLLLSGEAAGPAHGPAVLFLHGGGQTRHSWGGAIAACARAGFRAITMDLRGHGDSEWAPDGRYDLETLRGDLLDLLATLPPRPAIVGASLGGLTALLTIGTGDADLARALVLVDVVPQIETAGASEIRAFMRGHPDGFATVDDAADAVAAYLPHRERPTDHRGLMHNLRLAEDGRYHWHWDPRMLDGVGRVDPVEQRAALEDAARAVRVPTLLIRGGRSRVVSLDGVRALQRLIPHCDFVQVEHADHMVAGDANDDFNTPLLEFLQRID